MLLFVNFWFFLLSTLNYNYIGGEVNLFFGATRFYSNNNWNSSQPHERRFGLFAQQQYHAVIVRWNHCLFNAATNTVTCLHQRYFVYETIDSLGGIEESFVLIASNY